jgi:iron complex outermembrane receptor protein
MGFSTNVNWKKWFGGLVARANIGNYMYNNRFAGSGTERNILNPLSYLQNGSVNVLETDFIGGGSRYFLSDYYVENASFLRMDNIYVGYNLGNRLGKTTNLRLSGNVQNVFTVTKYRGVDPEINGGIDNSFYPRPRVFSLSLNLDF